MLIVEEGEESIDGNGKVRWFNRCVQLENPKTSFALLMTSSRVTGLSSFEVL